MEKCTQCGKNAIQQVGDNYLCLDCLERLSTIHHRENEQRHREMLSNMQMMMEAERNMCEAVGMPYKPSFDLSVFRPSRNIKLSNVNVSDSVVGNISTEEVGNITVSLKRIYASGDKDTAEKFQKITEAILQAQDIDNRNKNEILEQISLLSEQASLPAESRKTGIIKAAASAIKETAKTIGSVAMVWSKIEPLIKQLLA